MRNSFLASLGGLLLTFPVVAAPRAAAPSAAPPPDQIYASFENGDYAQTLRQLATALAVQGDAAAVYDRHELLVLKGETQLRLKNSAAAAAAFDEASKATKDEEKAAVDRATAEVIRRAKGTTYSPAAKKGADPPARLDLTDPRARKEAFAAMFEEAKPRVAAGVKSARLSGKLPVMLDAFVLLGDLQVLEVAATGDAAATKELAADLGSRARALMARAVGEMADTVAEIEAAAFRVYEDVRPVGGSSQVVASGQVGLRAGEADLLRRIAGDCERIGAIAVGLKSLGAAGDDADALRTLRDDADAVATRARYVSGFRTDGDSDSVGMGYADPGGPARHDRPGTARVQRPARRGNAAAGPRGVGTGGVGSGTR